MIWLLWFLLALVSTPAQAQCTGIFSAQQICGSVFGGVPKAELFSHFGGAPGGTVNSFQFNNGGGFTGSVTNPFTNVGLSLALAHTGTTNVFPSVTGTFTQGDCVTVDINGNLVDGGAPCVAATAGVTAGNQNQLAYYAANGSIISAVTTPTANAVVSTTAGSVPQESTTLPGSLTIPSPDITGTPTGNIVSSLTAAGGMNQNGKTGAVVINSGGGFANILRNASFTAWDHWKFYQVAGVVTLTSATFTGTIATINPNVPYAVLTASAVSGTISPMQQISGAGVPGGTQIVGDASTGSACAFFGGTACTGTGGAGTYLIYDPSGSTPGPVSMYAAGGWCPEGWFIYWPQTGGNPTVDCGQEGTGVSQSPTSGFSIKPSATLTNLYARYVFSNDDASKFGCNIIGGVCHGGLPLNLPVTFTIEVLYETANSYQPKLSSCIAAGADNFDTCAADLSPVNLQQCTGLSTACVLSYSWTPGTNAFAGYSLNFDCGAVSAGDNCKIFGADFRITPGAATGLNSFPPPLEIPEIVGDKLRNSTFARLVLPQGKSSANQVGFEKPFVVESPATTGLAFISFPTPMRCPTYALVAAQDAYTCPIPNINFSWGSTVAGNVQIAVGASTPAITSVIPFDEDVSNVTLQLGWSGALTAGSAGYWQLAGGSILIESPLIGN